MSSDRGPRVGEVLPTDAWDILQTRPGSVLVDVRTRAEWGFVGVPDLSGLGRNPLFVEWAAFPDMSRNPAFEAQVTEPAGDQLPETFLFICRSGARSMKAAEAVAAHLAGEGWSGECLNVAEGFEGDLDRDGHRGTINGWKARGLAWRQS